MLLRRITKHVTDQNWFAVFIDFLIVVVGILIAFQITEWNESRVNDAVEQQYIERLSNDFIEIEARLEGNIRYFDESLSANKFVKSVIAEQGNLDVTDDKKFKLALRQLFGSRIPAGESSTFLEMQSAGDINLLSSLELRAALRAYSQTTQISHTGWEALINERLSINEFFDQYVIYAENEDATDGTSSYEIEEYDLPAMIKSTQYLKSLNTMFRIQLNNRQLQRIQKQKADTVIQTLNSIRGT